VASSVIRARLGASGSRAFKSFVRTSSDRRLELTFGTRPGLQMLFTQLAARLPPIATAFAGELQCDLHRSDGSQTSWTIESRPGRAIARRGPAQRPALTARLSVADMIRIAAGELDPGRAVLEGRLDFAGNFGVMNRLMSIFR
jgi:hypothetical protein